MTLDLALIGNGAIGLLVDPLGTIVWRNTRLRRAVFLPRCGSSIFARAADEIEMNLGSLDATDHPMPTSTYSSRPTGTMKSVNSWMFDGDQRLPRPTGVIDCHAAR